MASVYTAAWRQMPCSTRHPDADLAPGELFGAGKIKGEGSPVYPVAAAELPVQLLQGLLVKILLLQRLGRQAVYLLEGPVHGVGHARHRQTGAQLPQIHHPDATDATPLLAILAGDGLR